MRRRVLTFLMAAVVTAPIAGNAQRDHVASTGRAAVARTKPLQLGGHGCHDAFLRSVDQDADESGPLTLVAIDCVEFGSGCCGNGAEIVSPDGTAVARWQRGIPAPVEIAALGRSGTVTVPNRVTFENIVGIGGGSFGTAPDALAWSSDSSVLWAVRQKVMNPSGFALSGLYPMQISREGDIKLLPELRHRAGPLDGLLWVGGNGLALAQFGVMGNYYKPEHDDVDPTLAIVDAVRGRVLASLPALIVQDLRKRVQALGLRVSGATATVLPDGRIKAVVQFGRWAERPAGTPDGKSGEPIIHPGVWLVWTQGETPQEWTAPYADDRSNPLALSSDGSKLLVVRSLQPEGVQVSCRIPCRGPPRPPPTPVSGPVAELIDVGSGRVVWRLPATATQFWSQGSAPAISPDGHYALIEVPPRSKYRPIALVDMKNGRVVQTIKPSHVGSYQHSFGFTKGGHRAWGVVGNTVRTYAFRP
jgi:hypothetical protein